MSHLDQEQEIIDLASKLGLEGSPAEGIVGYCQSRIDSWVEEASGVNSVEELESVVARNLHLTFEEILDDDDLTRLIARYVEQDETVFATLSFTLTPDTFGTLIRLKNGTFAAVIDGRGDKANRRFFTKWHEVAHLIVEGEDFDEQVFRATHDPLEKLMDQIAGQIGFYEPLFTPIFEANVSPGDLLTFDAVEQVRQSFCPYASFQSTLYACHRRMTTAMLYVETKMQYREQERRSLNQGRLFDDDRPQPKLRVSQVVPNNAAVKSGLVVRWNMRVPEGSVIHKLFQEDETELSGDENLAEWTFSGGGGLKPCEVFIQARSIGEAAMVTIQPRNGATDLGGI